MKEIINNIIADLGDKKRKFVIWHDGGEWIVSLEGQEMTNCKTLKEWITDIIRKSLTELPYVIELSDEEIKILSRSEMAKMLKSAQEHDGIHGFIYKGKLIKL